MQFKRALAGKNFDAAWMLALELPPPLVDALALLLLARDADPERFVRGAVRVHARLCAEANLTLEEAQLRPGGPGRIARPWIGQRRVRADDRLRGARLTGEANGPRGLHGW